MRMTNSEKNEYSRKYSKTKNGWLSKVYRKQKSSSKQRKHPMPNYTKIELYNWIHNNYLELFDQLWDDYELNNFEKDFVPSLDRIDNTKPYILSNLQLMTWKENNAKGRIENSGKNNKRSKPKEYYSKKSNRRDCFKTICKHQKWNFEDFHEIYSNEHQGENKKYYYVMK